MSATSTIQVQTSSNKFPLLANEREAQGVRIEERKMRKSAGGANSKMGRQFYRAQTQQIVYRLHTTTALFWNYYNTTGPQHLPEI